MFSWQPFLARRIPKSICTWVFNCFSCSGLCAFSIRLQAHFVCLSPAVLFPLLGRCSGLSCMPAFAFSHGLHPHPPTSPNPAFSFLSPPLHQTLIQCYKHLCLVMAFLCKVNVNPWKVGSGGKKGRINQRSLQTAEAEPWSRRPCQQLRAFHTFLSLINPFVTVSPPEAPVCAPGRLRIRVGENLVSSPQLGREVQPHDNVAPNPAPLHFLSGKQHKGCWQQSSMPVSEVPL